MFHSEIRTFIFDYNTHVFKANEIFRVYMLQKIRVQRFISRGKWEAMVLFGLRFYIPVNSDGHVETVSSANHTFFWASLTKQLISTLCTYFGR